MLEVVTDDMAMETCDHMLIYLNALTWAHEPEAFAADIRNAMRLGVHLQLCHEFPSVLDSGSARRALEFKEIIDVTPPVLTRSPRNIYSQIAVALKGGELRYVGLASVAAKLAKRVPRAPIADDARRGTFTERVGFRKASSVAQLVPLPRLSSMTK